MVTNKPKSYRASAIELELILVWRIGEASLHLK